MERPHRPDPRRARAGFTLIEVLVVVVIIGILVALLVPAIASAFRKAKEAQVTAELNNFGTALANFKTTFGDFPPSRLILHELGFNAITTTGNAIAGADSSNSDITDQQLLQRSLLYMRRFFPRVNFNDATTNSTTQKFFDFNGNGTLDNHVLVLNGSECLAFFLGGLPIHNVDPSTGATIVTGVSGFGKSPVNPFISQATVSNRTTPNFEFVAGRLIDLDGDGIPSYIDPLDVTIGNRRAYAYFSAYGVNGYDPNDINGYDHNTSSAIDYEMEDDPTSTSLGTVNVERGFLVNFPVYLSGGTTAPTVSGNMAFSPAPNPYTSGAAASGTVAWQNPNSYQILSAGADRQWGLGGAFVSKASNAGALPVPTNDPGLMHAFDADSASPNSAVRQREYDNLTNFSGGRLQ